MLYTFRESSPCRHVHHELMRSAALNLTLIIPATVCHQTNYVERYSRFTDKVYLPTIVCGRVIWHLGYTEEASAAALTQSYGEFQRAASQREPSYRVRGILTDGFDSTVKSVRTLFPGARLGNCLRHALNKLPKKLMAIASPVRQSLRAKFHTLLSRARQRKSWRVFALGQRLRHFADHVAQRAGVANGERVRRWFQEKLCREKRQGGM